jgi:hypothetical protein
MLILFSQTNQPYAFTNDDHMNAEDPLGMMLTDIKPLGGMQVAITCVANELILETNGLNGLRVTIEPTIGVDHKISCCYKGEIS